MCILFFPAGLLDVSIGDYVETHQKKQHKLEATLSPSITIKRYINYKITFTVLFT